MTGSSLLPSLLYVCTWIVFQPCTKIIAIASIIAKRLEAHSPRDEAEAYPSSVAVAIILATTLHEIKCDAAETEHVDIAVMTKLAASLNYDDGESLDVLIELIDADEKAIVAVSPIPSSSNKTNATSSCCLRISHSELPSIDIPIAFTLLSQKDRVIVIAASISIADHFNSIGLDDGDMFSLIRWIKALKIPSLEAICKAALR